MRGACGRPADSGLVPGAAACGLGANTQRAVRSAAHIGPPLPRPALRPARRRARPLARVTRHLGGRLLGVRLHTPPRLSSRASERPPAAAAEDAWQRRELLRPFSHPCGDLGLGMRDGRRTDGLRGGLESLFLGSEGSLNWSREVWILVKRLLGAASRKYSGSQMIPLVSSRRQRQSNLPSDVDKRASRDGQFDHESFIRG